MEFCILVQEGRSDFSDIAESFLSFVDGAELVIHNADFDVGFINSDMVENLDFFSNGFSSKYGNKLSSFGDIIS